MLSRIRISSSPPSSRLIEIGKPLLGVFSLELSSHGGGKERRKT
jgi:hypothetical protein